MATEWYHEFAPEFSGLMVVVFFGLMAFAFIGGRLSVKLRPRRRNEGSSKFYEDEPRYFSKKVKSFKENYSVAFRSNREIADSVICFSGIFSDVLWAVLAGIAFAALLVNEHYDGIAQFVINHLNASDAAAWGDLGAGVIIAVVGIVVGLLFYCFRAVGQFLKADKLVRSYLYGLRKRPLMFQMPSPLFIAKHTAWAISKEIEERREAKVAKITEAIERAEKELEARDDAKVISLPEKRRHNVM